MINCISIMKRAFYFLLFLFYSTFLSAQFVTGFTNTTYPDEPGSGYTLDFDGINDFVSIPDDDDLSFGDGANDQAFTLSTWVRLNSTPFGVSNIISKSVGGANYEYQLTLQSPGVLTANIRDASTSAFVIVGSNQLVFPGVWTHVAMTYDGSGNSAGITLYINGVDVTGFPNTIGGYVAMENSVGDLFLGSAGGVGNFSDINMDETRIWSAELGVNTIREWMTKKINPTHPNIAALESYYRFDEVLEQYWKKSERNPNIEERVNSNS